MKNKEMNVPFFLPFIDKSDISEIKNAALSTFLTNGPKLDRFEKQFQNRSYGYLKRAL